MTLLLLGARGHDRGCTAAGQPDVKAGSQEFFLDDVLADAVAVLAAVFLRIAVTQPAALADLLMEGLEQRAVTHGVPRLRAAFDGVFGFIQLGHQFRCGMGADEFAQVLAQLGLLSGEAKIHVRLL